MSASECSGDVIECPGCGRLVNTYVNPDHCPNVDCEEVWDGDV